MRKIISFMHISLDGFIAGPNGEMNRIKVDEEIFDHVGKRSIHCPPLAEPVPIIREEVLQRKCDFNFGVE